MEPEIIILVLSEPHKRLHILASQLFKINFYLGLVLLSGLFPSDFLTNILCKLLSAYSLYTVRPYTS
jgi:hypothetical protein